MKSLILPLKNYIPATQMPKCLSHPLHKTEATKQHSLRAASSLVGSVLQQEVKGHPGMFWGTLKKADSSVGESLAQWPQFLWCCVHEFSVLAMEASLEDKHNLIPQLWPQCCCTRGSSPARRENCAVIICHLPTNRAKRIRF